MELARVAKANIATGTRTPISAACPEGFYKVRVKYSTSDWPVDPDGEITIRLIASTGGKDTVLYQDTFVYKRARVIAGRDIDAQCIECKLDQPIGKDTTIKVEAVAPKTFRSAFVLEAE